MQDINTTPEDGFNYDENGNYILSLKDISNNERNEKSRLRRLNFKNKVAEFLNIHEIKGIPHCYGFSLNDHDPKKIEIAEKILKDKNIKYKIDDTPYFYSKFLIRRI